MLPTKRKSTRKGVDEDSAVPFKKCVVRPSGEGESQDDLPLSQDSVASLDRDLLSIDCLKLLAEKGFADVAKVLQEEGVTNELIDRVTESQLKDLEIKPLGKRLEAIKCIQKITEGLYGYKILNDPIHGHIEIHPLCVRIVDTPQFQRLRSIKQLGGVYFVYPGAAHNRFEHSLGVCYLAGQLTSTLRKRQPDLEISNTDVLCVQIAGLCHDLGHGPLSHMFDKKFLPVARPKDKIKHEDLSVKMFDHLVSSNNLLGEFEKYGLTEQDRTFIKEQIAGPRKHIQKNWPYSGRSKDKRFLYEIVANKRNEIDVDKWDYFARDCHMLGIKNNFDHTRYMKFARVLKFDNELQICSRDKEVGNLYDMFHTRNALHRRAYQHSVGNSIEIMITEALLKADEFIKIPGTNGEMRKLSETVDDMEAYQKLTDFIVEQILWSTDDKLKESREILMRVQRRQLFKCVGKTRPPKDSDAKEKGYEEKVKDDFVEILKKMDRRWGRDDIIIHLVFLDYGMKDKNPIDHVRFYNKKDPTAPIQVRKDQVSDLLPEKFAEQLIRFYCKKADEASLQQATEAFNRWCQQHQCSVGDDSLMPDMTPVKSDPSAGNCSTTPESSKIPDSQNTPGTASKFKSRLKFD